MQISSETLSAVNNLITSGGDFKYQRAYTLVLNDLKGQNLTLNSSDQNVLTWLGKAIEINGGELTINSIAVRAQLQMAMQADKGKSISLFGPEEQQSSDAVAKAFFGDLSKNSGVLPNFSTLVNTDVPAGLGAVGLPNDDHAIAVPDAVYGPTTGFSDNTGFYDSLTPAEQNHADFLHLGTLAITAVNYYGLLTGATSEQIDSWSRNAASSYGSQSVTSDLINLANINANLTNYKFNDGIFSFAANPTNPDAAGAVAPSIPQFNNSPTTSDDAGLYNALTNSLGKYPNSITVNSDGSLNQSFLTSDGITVTGRWSLNSSSSGASAIQPEQTDTGSGIGNFGLESVSATKQDGSGVFATLDSTTLGKLTSWADTSAAGVVTQKVVYGEDGQGRVVHVAPDVGGAASSGSVPDPGDSSTSSSPPGSSDQPSNPIIGDTLNPGVQTNADGSSQLSYIDENGARVTESYNANGDETRETSFNAATGESRVGGYNSDGSWTDNIAVNGLPTETVTYLTNGGRIETSYNSDLSVSWATRTEVVDDDSDIVGTLTYNMDGSRQTEVVDPDTGNKTITTYDGQGNKVSQAVSPGMSYTTFANQIAATVLTRVIADQIKNVPAAIATEAAGKALLDVMLEAKNHQVDFSTDSTGSLVTTATGFLSSDIGNAIGRELGLSQDLTSVVLQPVTQVATNLVVNGVANELGVSLGNLLDTTSLSTGIVTEAADLLSSKLLGLFITPTQDGILGGAAAQAGALLALPVIAGGTTDAAIAGLLGLQPELAPLVIFAAVFGSNFVGNLIGDAINAIFGSGYRGVPNADIRIMWDGGRGVFYVGHAGADNNGSTAGVTAEAQAFVSALNNLMTAIGGNAVYPPATFTLIQYGDKWYYAYGDQNAAVYPDGFNTPNEAISAGLTHYVSTLTIANANPYMAYVARQSASETLDQLNFDLTAANNFGLYSANQAAFNVALALKNDPATYDAWQQQLARAQQLGLDKLTPAELAGIKQFGALTPNDLYADANVAGAVHNFLSTDGAQEIVNTGADGFQVFNFDNRANILTNTTALRTIIGALWSPPDGAKIVTSGNNLTSDGSAGLVVKDAQGNLSLVSFDNQGQAFETLALQLQGVPALPANAQFFGAFAQGNGRFSLLVADGQGHSFAYTFNAQGQAVKSQELNYSPTAYISQPIPPTSDPDARTALWRATAEQAGFHGDFDGKRIYSWFADTYGAQLDSGTDRGFAQLRAVIAANSPVITGFAPHLNGAPGYDVTLRGPSGQTVIDQIDAAGNPVTEMHLGNANGSDFTLATDATITLGGRNSAGVGEQSVLIHYADGQIAMGAVDSSGTVTQVTNVIDSNNQALTLGSDYVLADIAWGYLGTNGQTLFISGPNGLLIKEVDTGGKIVAEQNPVNSDGTPYGIPDGAVITNTGDDYFNLGERDLILHTSDNNTVVVGFDITGNVLATSPFYDADGSHTIGPASDTVIIVGRNYYTHGGIDTLSIDSANMVSVFERDAGGKADSDGGLIYNRDGGVLTEPFGTTPLPFITGVFGSTDRELLFLQPDRTLQMLRLDLTDPRRVVDNQVLTGSDLKPFVLSEGSRIADVNSDQPGHYTLTIAGSDGTLTTYGLENHGQLIANNVPAGASIAALQGPSQGVGQNTGEVFSDPVSPAQAALLNAQGIATSDVEPAMASNGGAPVGAGQNQVVITDPVSPEQAAAFNAQGIATSDVEAAMSPDPASFASTTLASAPAASNVQVSVYALPAAQTTVVAVATSTAPTETDAPQATASMTAPSGAPLSDPVLPPAVVTQSTDRSLVATPTYPLPNPPTFTAFPSAATEVAGNGPLPAPTAPSAISTQFDFDSISTASSNPLGPSAVNSNEALIPASNDPLLQSPAITDVAAAASLEKYNSQLFNYLVKASNG